MSNPSPDQILSAVREHYGEIARAGQDDGGCCSTRECACDSLYPADQLADLPASVTDLSLGCGNPVGEAGIREGDTVLDLGAGGGIDCFLAARLVGPTGRVVGVDMTPTMLDRARANAFKLGVANVEFRLGQIEALPVGDSTVDVIISNCVINLSPDKAQVFREMFRALRPGGRIAISDIVTDGPMSPLVAQGTESWAACVAGALDASEYEAGLRAAGFVEVRLQTGPDASGGLSAGAAQAAGMPFSALITARKP